MKLGILINLTTEFKGNCTLLLHLVNFTNSRYTYSETIRPTWVKVLSFINLIISKYTQILNYIILAHLCSSEISYSGWQSTQMYLYTIIFIIYRTCIRSFTHTNIYRAFTGYLWKLWLWFNTGIFLSMVSINSYIFMMS